MEDIEKTKVKVVNHLTGEITEREVTNAEDAKNLYLELTASERAISNAKKSIIGVLDKWLGGEREYKFADGKVMKRVQRESKQWTIEGLKRIGLNEDAIAVLSTVDMKLARTAVKEMLEKGEVRPDAGKILDEYADISVTKPFVEIR